MSADALSSAADTMREAAAQMRERAEAASAWDGLPWFAVGEAVYGGTAAPHQVVTPVTTYDGDAEHIASWHPGVARSVARLLVMVAAGIDAHNATGPQIEDAYQIARAYLGEADA